MARERRGCRGNAVPKRLSEDRHSHIAHRKSFVVCGAPVGLFCLPIPSDPPMCPKILPRALRSSHVPSPKLRMRVVEAMDRPFCFQRQIRQVAVD